MAHSAATSATNSISTDTNESNDDTSQLKMHAENDSKVSPSDRYSYIIGLALSCIDGFNDDTLKEEPFSYGERNKTKAIKKFLIQETQR